MTPRILFVSLLAAAALLTGPGAAADREEGQPAARALAPTRETAQVLLLEIRMLDAAVDQWAIENNKPAGAMPKPEELAVYLKKETRLHKELAAGRLTDALGHPMILRGVDKPPLVAPASVEQLAAVASASFWKPFYEGPEFGAAPPAPAAAEPVTPAEFRQAANRQSQELRMLDSALDQWAIENNKPDGAQARPQDLLPYLKSGTRLYNELAAGRTNDLLGNPITIPPIGTPPTISPATAKKFAPHVPEGFWGPFEKK